MLHAVDLDHYGLYNPPAAVHAFEAESESLDRVRAAQDDFNLDRWVAESAERVNAMVSDAERGELKDIDAAMAHLESLENELREVRVGLDEECSQVAELRKQAMSLPEVKRGKMLAKTEKTSYRARRLLLAVKSVLRFYRDGRWALMVVQSEGEPASETPVFDEAESLLAYLKT